MQAFKKTGVFVSLAALSAPELKLVLASLLIIKYLVFRVWNSQALLLLLIQCTILPVTVAPLL